MRISKKYQTSRTVAIGSAGPFLADCELQCECFRRCGMTSALQEPLPLTVDKF